jgi:hypothetical protein
VNGGISDCEECCSSKNPQNLVVYPFQQKPQKPGSVHVPVKTTKTGCVPVPAKTEKVNHHKNE